MKQFFRFSNTLILIAVFITSSLSYAQEYDLKSFVSLVKENNIDLKQSSNQILITKEESKITRSLILPSITLDGNYQRDFTKNFLFINDESDGSITRFRTNFNNTIDFNATLSQTIFDPVAFSEVRIAKLAEELALLNHKNIFDELITQASSLYWQTVFVKESIKVLEENSNLAKEQIDQIQKIYASGAVSELQVKQAEALYKKTIPPLNNSKNQYKNLINELKALANLPIKATFIINDNLETIQFNKLLDETNSNFEKQPQIKALKKELEIAEKQIKAKNKFWYPKLHLITAYNYNAQDNDFNFSNNENKLFFGQVRVSVPIFSGGSNRAEISKAKIEKETSELAILNKKQEFLKQLQIAENDYNNAVANMVIHRETTLLNEKEIEIFNKQLKLGVVTPIEFKEVRLRLTQSKLNLLNDYLDIHIAKLKITRILGTNN